MFLGGTLRIPDIRIVPKSQEVVSSARSDRQIIATNRVEPRPRWRDALERLGGPEISWTDGMDEVEAVVDEQIGDEQKRERDYRQPVQPRCRGSIPVRGEHSEPRQREKDDAKDPFVAITLGNEEAQTTRRTECKGDMDLRPSLQQDKSRQNQKESNLGCHRIGVIVDEGALVDRW